MLPHATIYAAVADDNDRTGGRSVCVSVCTHSEESHLFSINIDLERNLFPDCACVCVLSGTKSEENLLWFIRYCVRVLDLVFIFG